MKSIDKYVVQALDNYPSWLEETIESLGYALAYDNKNVTALCLYGRFHAEQFARDTRDMEYAPSFGSTTSSSYSQFSYGGSNMNFVASSQEACRLTSNSCSADYQCCGGKCRCTKWSVSGQVSCLKKCF